MLQQQVMCTRIPHPGRASSCRPSSEAMTPLALKDPGRPTGRHVLQVRVCQDMSPLPVFSIVLKALAGNCAGAAGVDMGLGGEWGLGIPGEHAAAALPQSPQAEHPSRAIHIFIYQLHQRSSRYGGFWALYLAPLSLAKFRNEAILSGRSLALCSTRDGFYKSASDV